MTHFIKLIALVMAANVAGAGLAIGIILLIAHLQGW